MEWVLGVHLLPCRVTLARCAALLWLPLALLCAGVPAGAAPSAVIQPAAGAVLTAPPPAVTARLEGPPSRDARLEVLNARRQDMGNGPPQVFGDTLRVTLPRLAPGIYTVTWSSGTVSGASSFTVWQGGPLPPAMLRAAYGGPVQGPLPPALGPCLLIALLAGLVGLGSLALPSAGGAPGFFPRSGADARGRSSSGLLRLAGLTLAGACAAADAMHTQAVVGVPIRSLFTDPLTRLVLLRGIGLGGLVAAGLGIGAAALARNVRGSAALLGLALIPVLLMVPAVQGGNGITFVVALATGAGLGLYAGAWPHALRHRAWANPVPRLLGLAVALAAGIPLFLHWRPVRGVPGIVAACAALCAIVLGRPNAARRLTGLAQILGLAAAVSLAPALAASSQTAGVRLLPRQLHWAYATPGRSTNIRLAVSPLQVGVNVVRITDPAAHSVALPVTLRNANVPGLTRRLTLPRIAAGVYALATPALSQPGLWQVDAVGETFHLALGSAAPLVQGCQGAFQGFDAEVARLRGSVRALATDPGDGTLAIAATSAGVYATNDGGRTWRPAGNPGLVNALAIGLYGEWFAATSAGLQVSQDGGAHWNPAAGPRTAVSAVAAPLYPAGTLAWALSTTHTYGGASSQTFTTSWATHWTPAGPSPPNGTLTLLALPGALSGQPVTLLSAGSAGLAVSTDGGQRWKAVAGVPGPLPGLAAGAKAFWAAGPAGIFTAARPQGPWRSVPLAVFGPVTGIAAAGPNGDEVFTAVAGAGLLVTTDGGSSWRGAGCTGGTISTMVGTFTRGLPVPPPSGAPLLYIGDVSGQVASLWPAATTAGG